VPKFAVILFVFTTSATSVFASPIDIVGTCATATANGGWGLSDEVACLKDAIQPKSLSTDSGARALDGALAEDLRLGEYVRLLAHLRREVRFRSDQTGLTVVPLELFVIGDASFPTDAATWVDSTAPRANMVTNPEPASLVLLGSGIAAGIARRRSMLRMRNADSGRRSSL
jgi:hypothetical protein